LILKQIGKPRQLLPEIKRGGGIIKQILPEALSNRLAAAPLLQRAPGQQLSCQVVLKDTRHYGRV
jgi:hypothetical protein